MNLGTTPERVLTFPTVDDLARAPDRHRRESDFEDSEPHFWSYQQTDQNRHIHAMDYVRTMELFAVDHMAHLGHSPRDFILERIRVAFRAPCFTGEQYHRKGILYSAANQPLIVNGTLYKAEDGIPADRPAVATQMFARELAPEGTKPNRR